MSHDEEALHTLPPRIPSPTATARQLVNEQITNLPPAPTSNNIRLPIRMSDTTQKKQPPRLLHPYVRQPIESDQSPSKRPPSLTISSFQIFAQSSHASEVRLERIPIECWFHGSLQFRRGSIRRNGYCLDNILCCILDIYTNYACYALFDCLRLA